MRIKSRKVTNSFALRAATPLLAAFLLFFASCLCAQTTPLVVGMTAEPAGIVGQYYLAPLPVSGGTSPYAINVTSGQLPSGLSLYDGLLWGIPTAEGTYNFIFAVIDATGAQATGSMTISVVSPLSITSTSIPAGTVGASYSAAVSTSGGVTPLSFGLVSGQLPAGLTLSSSGVISGAPTTAGTYSFTLQATDAAGEQASQTFGTTIQNAAPSSAGSLQIVTASLHLGYVQQAYQGAMSAKYGTPPYTWSISSGALPTGLALDSSTGAISGTPTASGNFSVGITVTDSKKVTAQQSYSTEVSGLLFDAYGGLMNLTSPEGGTGYWRVEKFGNRWLFVTPAGHGFFMTGVYGVNPGYTDNTPDEMGETYYSRVQKKYGDGTTTWGIQTNRRLKSWGFNTVGPYSYYYALPVVKDANWGGGTNPVKMPFIIWVGVTHYAFTNADNYASGPTKSIIHGVNPAYCPAYGTFPDVYDPNFDAYANGVMSNDINTLLPDLNSPYLIGVFVDDRDYLMGFGAGTDFPTNPEGNATANLAWVALVTAPTQTTNPFNNQPYTDTTVYTKLALSNFLEGKYGSIGALNAAWGSDYTTFGSAGGWGTGTGLLDEDGRHSTWLGTDPYGLSNANAAIRTDLNAFLFQLASKYFSILRTRLKQHDPNILYLGPTTIGGWDSPAHAPIIQAAAKYVDVYSTELDQIDPAKLNFIVQNLGDKPIIYWGGMMANPDSSRWRYPNPLNETPNMFLTQSARGQEYAAEMASYVNTVAAPTGSIPSIGLLFWDWTDSIGQETNWGLVTLMDNAYDGKESTISGGAPGIVGSANCADPWGFPCGAEEHNYGDFIDSVRNANLNALETASGN